MKMDYGCPAALIFVELRCPLLHLLDRKDIALSIEACTESDNMCSVAALFGALLIQIQQASASVVHVQKSKSATAGGAAVW